VGRLLRIEPCPVCNYHVEGALFFGGSTRTRLFIFHRYVIGHCHACNNLVSVLVRTPEYDLEQMLAAAEKDIETLQARIAEGDEIARRLLPLHQMALDEEDDMSEGTTELHTCSVCGSQDVSLHLSLGGDDGEHFDDGTAWVACPSCEEGQIWVRAFGHWDEIDSGI
jgi:hypothetical protein